MLLYPEHLHLHGSAVEPPRYAPAKQTPQVPDSADIHKVRGFVPRVGFVEMIFKSLVMND